MLQALKFKETDFDGRDVASLPDRPGDSGITAAELKARFDQIGKVMLALGNYNALLDLLMTGGAAAQIGALVPGLAASDIAAALEELNMLKENKVAGKSLSENDFTNVLKAKLEGIEAAANVNIIERVKVNGIERSVADKAVDISVPTKTSQITNDSGFVTSAQVLTKDNTAAYTPTAPYHPVTKQYADNLAIEAGAVTSVFGRAGAVMPQAGDYTAEMVGAVDVEDIANNLTTTEAGKVLDARQAYILQISKADKSTIQAATLLAASWVGEVTPYIYTLTVAGVTETSNQEILPSLTATQAQIEALQAANILDGGQSVGQIVLKAWGDKPAIDIPIRVIVRGDM